MKVIKTIKLYMNGGFPRTESGRTYTQKIKGSSEVYARLCQASRKDFRNAVEFAKGAQGSWAKRSAYNRGQILYRMAEMMEGKRAEFKDVLTVALGMSDKDADIQIDAGRDAFVYYAGFSDKYTQLMGSINPVASAHHNFSSPEAVGVVTHFDNNEFSLPNLCARLAAIIVSGNTVISLLSAECPSILAPLSEVFATSDLPAGVINLLTGDRDELYKHVGSHKEVRSIVSDDTDQKFFYSLKELGVDNMKRFVGPRKDLLSLEAITECVEIKTAWHPIGM